MKVRIFGFQWQTGNGITLEDFCNHLQSISGQENSGKMIALDAKDGYWAGVLLTIKDMKAYCQMKRKGGGFKIMPQKLDDDSRMADFNYFIIHPQTGRGLYQHYHQSPVANTFCNFCRRRYNAFRDEKIGGEIEAAGGDNISNSDYKKIRSKYKGYFSFQTLLRQEDFLKCVSAMKSVKNFAFELATITDEEKLFTPASEYAKRCSHKVFFGEDTLVSNVKNGIAGTVEKFGLKRATVHGQDEYGQDTVYKLLNDYATYEEFEYDDIIGSVELDSENLKQSVCDSMLVEELLKVAARPEVKALLSAKTK
jgi:hypothetical protein